MATVNPRIYVTVTPRVHAVLSRFSSATGRSKSSMIGELLEESFPMFVKMVKVIEAAKVVEKDLAANMIAPFNEAQSHLESQLGLVLGSVDLAADDLLAQVEAVGRRARKPASGARGAGAVRSPGAPRPPSNRGGGYPQQIGGQSGKPLNRRGKVK